jgi:hypothetical protein
LILIGRELYGFANGTDIIEKYDPVTAVAAFPFVSILKQIFFFADLFHFPKIGSRFVAEIIFRVIFVRIEKFLGEFGTWEFNAFDAISQLFAVAAFPDTASPFSFLNLFRNIGRTTETFSEIMRTRAAINPAGCQFISFFVHILLLVLTRFDYITESGL